ncbi:MAG: hypothetical protein COT74_02785 [Bdellovibrionales bacterium CG10_big_fil_rev_8_21_14_0_10_45_34]|nr:MAG: hypothetical protein COT74_02785 [Bdellovibrionales bacterium CG10_big_fil_rev_8_21_14_0_10_45_34]
MSNHHETCRAIREAQSILLTTHREGDGDGIGSQVALYTALKKLGKTVRMMNVDLPAPRYHFVKGVEKIEVFNPAVKILKPDLVIVFDTNDLRYFEPFSSHLVKMGARIVFIDHHPHSAPIRPAASSFNSASVIDTKAASTGEITFDIIKGLGVSLDPVIAGALYTSIVFDTQLFRFIRGSKKSHVIAAEILEFVNDPEQIHVELFGRQTPNKMKLLSEVLSSVDYTHGDRVAWIKVKLSQLNEHQLDTEASRDIVDMIMAIDSISVAVLIREDAPEEFKISLRSKVDFEVLPIAETLGGGGHRQAAGAYFSGPYDDLRALITETLSESFNEERPAV